MGRPLIFVNTDNFPRFCDNRCLNTNCSKHLSRLAGHSGGAKISKLRGTPDCKAAIMAIRIILAAAGAAILILAATGIFTYAVVAKAWNELFD